MALTPTQLIPFLQKRLNAARGAFNAIEQRIRASVPKWLTVGDEQGKKPPSMPSFIEDFRNLKASVSTLQEYAAGLRQLREDDHKEIFNPNWDAIEIEVGMERQSNPKTNYIQNGGFRVWNAAVNLPLGWTASGAPTISRVSARTGAQGGNYAAQVASGGAAGSISRTFRVKPSSKYKIAGWIAMAASATVTVTATTDGGTPVVVTTPSILTNANFGTGWLSFPRPQLDVLDIETPSDATQITIKLEVDVNHTADFSDFQAVQGPRCDPDLWEPAQEDAEQAPYGNVPLGYGTSGQVLQTDGAGTTSWATPSTATSGTYSPTCTGTINIAAVNGTPCQYMRVGNVVTVSGAITIDPTLAAVQTQVRITLPIASALTQVYQLNGTACSTTSPGLSAGIYADAANDAAYLEFICTADAGSNVWTFQFTYQVL